MRIDPKKTAHLLFFLIILPVLSIGIAYLLNIVVHHFPSKYSSWYFLIDTVGVLGAYGFLYKMFDEHLWKYLPWNCFGVVDFPNIEGR